MGAVFVDMLGFLMVLPLLPFYAERMGADAFMVGVLISVFAFAQLVSAPLWGRISDRFGRRPVILAGLALSAVAFLLFGLAQSLLVLMLSRLVQGAGGGINGVIQAYVSDTVPAGDRAKALGWLTAATSAGVMLGPVLGSLAATISPAAPGLIAASLCLVNVLFASWLLQESSTGERSTAPRQSIRKAIKELFRHPGTPAHLVIWIYAVGMMAFMAMNGVLALFLERKFHVTEATIGYFYTFVGVISLVMRALILSPLINRFGEVPVLRLGALAMFGGLLLFPTPNSLFALAFVIALMPIGTSMLFPATTSQVASHARDGEVGQTLGLQQAMGGVSRMIGPIWAGAIFQHMGWGVPFYCSAALMAVAAAISIFLVADDGVGRRVVAAEGPSA